jgi:hypothetical protein
MSMPPTPLQIDYIDPDGFDWDLSDLSLSKGYVCSAISGIEGMPVAMTTVPLLDGTAIPNTYLPQPGTITLAILVGRPASDSENDYYTLLDRINRAFTNRRNDAPAPGYIQIQRPDGSVRQIVVYTTSGLNTPDTVGIHNYTVYAFTLQTPDPFWQDLVPQSISYGMPNALGIMPLLPVGLTSQVLGTNTIVNNGLASAWPTWTVVGPGIPTVRNITTGRQWSLNTSIPVGNVVQVTTKPGTQMAVNTTTSTNIWDQLVLSSLRDLWPLVSGTNQISITMTGSGANSSISLTWYNRWLRA